MLVTDTNDRTFCEFFAGIGLVHEALRDGGWRCVYANDISEKKACLYRRHFGPSPYYQVGDVWETEAVVEAIEASPVLATASFPCTDMSLAGRREGFGGEESSAFFGFTRAIESLGSRRPKLLMLENVVGFLNSRGGADFTAACETLADLGYWVDALILDAKDFLPQSRPRLFLFGFDSSLNGNDWTPRRDDEFPDRWLQQIEASGRLRNDRLIRLMRSTDLSTGWATLPLRPPRKPAYRLLDYLDIDAEQDWWDASMRDRHLAMMTPAHREQLEAWKTGPDFQVATAFRRIRQGEQRAEVRFDGVAGCLRTPRGGSARQIVAAAGQGEIRIRWMSPREYARLQGASEFPLADSDSQSLFGFGDAVCVPVIRWIDEHVFQPLLSEHPVESPR